MPTTRTLTEFELARIMMLIGAIHDLAELERRDRDHDTRMSSHLREIAEELEKIISEEKKTQTR